PDPVRDPDTGMIVPQTRRERRALEAAQEKVLARKTARQKSQPLQPESTPYDGENSATEDLDFGSNPASDLDPEETTVLTVTLIDDTPIHTPELQPAQEATQTEPLAGRNLPAAILVALILIGSAVVGIFFSHIVLDIFIAVLVPLSIWELAQVVKTK